MLESLVPAPLLPVAPLLLRKSFLTFNLVGDGQEVLKDMELVMDNLCQSVSPMDGVPMVTNSLQEDTTNNLPVASTFSSQVTPHLHRLIIHQLNTDTQSKMTGKFRQVPTEEVWGGLDRN